MNDQQYEMNEARLLAKQLDYVRLASLADRKQSKLEMLQAMIETPETVAERVSWLINGSYGRKQFRSIPHWPKLPRIPSR